MKEVIFYFAPKLEKFVENLENDLKENLKKQLTNIIKKYYSEKRVCIEFETLILKEEFGYESGKIAITLDNFLLYIEKDFFQAVYKKCCEAYKIPPFYSSSPLKYLIAVKSMDVKEVVAWFEDKISKFVALVEKVLEEEERRLKEQQEAYKETKTFQEMYEEELIEKLSRRAT
jgi:hypothetical protein